MADGIKEVLNKHLAALKQERSSFDAHYRDLAQFTTPRRGRFNSGERNRSDRSYWNNIINGHATWAVRVATSGMFNGLMSPSRPWFMLTTDDDDLLEYQPVKEWFYIVQERMRTIINASNLYNMAPTMFRELLVFATGCMSHEEDNDTLCRFYTHTVGSYYLGQNHKFQVDTVYRELEMTVSQIMNMFGNRDGPNTHISTAVRDQYDKGNYFNFYPVVHAVEPNSNFKPGSLRPNEKKFRSIYYEPSNNDRNTVLSSKGMRYFPFYCPRWEVTNEDIYGTDCPGMSALGDIRQLQHQEKRKAQGLDKMVTPPLHGPPSLRNQPISHLPAGATLYDPSGTHILKPVYEVRLPLDQLSADMQRVEDRINRHFLVDVFQAISSMEGIQPRNQLELMQRHQERLVQLGPVLEQMYSSFLDPFVSRLFDQMVEAGDYDRDNFIIPPPPEALQNRPLRVRFVSTLAMAQNASLTGNIDRMVSFVGALNGSGLINDSLKFDGDQAIDEYGKLIGIPPKLIRDDEKVESMRQAQAQQAQAQQAIAAGQGMADMAAKAGSIDLEEDNPVSRMMGPNNAAS